MLSCTCGDYYDWYYKWPKSDINEIDFAPLLTSKRKRCKSCNNLINIGDLCLCFPRWREARSDVEEEIHGMEVYLADGYLCEKCGEIWLNLTVLGYCLELGHDLHEDLEEYWDLTGFKPANQTVQPMPNGTG